MSSIVVLLPELCSFFNLRLIHNLLVIDYFVLVFFDIAIIDLLTALIDPTLVGRLFLTVVRLLIGILELTCFESILALRLEELILLPVAVLSFHRML